MTDKKKPTKRQHPYPNSFMLKKNEWARVTATAKLMIDSIDDQPTIEAVAACEVVICTAIELMLSTGTTTKADAILAIRKIARDMKKYVNELNN